ncbi:MAG: hypothetical protein HKO64_11675 [Xanthomonadales bacterium]|nr:thiamine-binding protein [Gammaproteobacteria bacterium]NNE05439.1 hypothetical protein [Xanthomonadales bacterium]NNL96272.1 hypothetical protein [Xanthomonadales bacterium]
MQLTAELSFYPLAEDYIPPIKAFITELAGQAGLQMVTNRMSTQISGSFDDVTQAINQAMRACMSGPGRAVLVVKYLNTALPVLSAPDLD